MPINVLLAEDEESIRDTLEMNLELEGYNPSVFSDGYSALESFKSNHYDLIILDIMLPNMDGIAVAREIRKLNSQIGILFVTAKGSRFDIVEGLKIGDDYIVKPFHLDELLLRIKNLLKRIPEKNELNSFSFGDNRVDFSTFEVQCKTGKIRLNQKEMALLKLLIDEKGKVVSRNEILNQVWKYDQFPTTRTIDNYVVNFRKYFEEDPKNPKHFISVRGVGYRFEV